MPGLTQSTLNYPVQKRRVSNLKENHNESSRRISTRLQQGNVKSIYNLDTEASPIKKRKNGTRKILGESSIANQVNLSSDSLKSPLKEISHKNNKIPLSPLPKYVLKTPEKSMLPSKNSPIKQPANFVSPIKLRLAAVSLDEANFTTTSIKHSPKKIEAFSPKKVRCSDSSSIFKKSPTKGIALARPDVEIYQRLKQKLSNNVEAKLVGREDEIKVMTDFLETHLTKSQPGSIYISGAPGTGKTASVLSIVDGLNLKSLKTVYLNCMNQKSTKDIFAEIASQFNVKTKQTESSLMKSIEKNITSQSTVLLILDEIDQLDSKNQSVLYTIFEWPTLANSKLVLVGIANMLDLTDRILPRLQHNPTTKPKLLHFPPYSRTEIINIIEDRIKSADIGNIEVIKQSAIRFLAGKIASVAGDVRKALDVCRRAVELTEAEVRLQSRLSVSSHQSPATCIKQIDIGRIHKLFNEVYSNSVTQNIQQNPHAIPLQQKVLICTLLLVLKYAKSKIVTISMLHEVYSKVCNRQRLPAVDQSEFLSLCFLLESRGILEIRKAKEPRNAKILMRLSQEETEQAMGDKNLMFAILEDKESLGRHCSKRK